MSAIILVFTSIFLFIPWIMSNNFVSLLNETAHRFRWTDNKTFFLLGVKKNKLTVFRNILHKILDVLPETKRTENKSKEFVRVICKDLILHCVYISKRNSYALPYMTQIKPNGKERNNKKCKQIIVQTMVHFIPHPNK